jgi:hypothetical protein
MRLGMHMECSVDLKLDEETAPGIAANAETVDFHRPLGTSMWSTASGRTIRHMVYSLVGCPPVKAAIYLLVHQAADGSRKILAVRATRSRFASVNLARIRHTGARWGANEVHLFRGARSDEERNTIVADLCRALRVRAPRAPRKPSGRKTGFRRRLAEHNR